VLACDNAVAGPSSNSGGQSKVQNAKKVLAIEFDSTLLEVRAAVLALGGFTVTMAVSKEAALEYCRASTFDAIVFGASIPRHDREHLSIELKSLHPEVPLIVVSEVPTDGLELASASVFNLDSPQALFSAIGMATGGRRE